jgi:hypothetical protein
MAHQVALTPLAGLDQAGKMAAMAIEEALQDVDQKLEGDLARCCCAWPKPIGPGARTGLDDKLLP